MTLFETIKKYSKIRGLSLQEVATRSGLSKNAIYNWKEKKASDVSEAYLIAIANTLGISYEELIGKKKKKEPTNIDLKAAMIDKNTVMSYGGRPIPDEELEMIRRILGGGK